MPNETWLAAAGSDGRVEVSDRGRVRRRDEDGRWRFVKPWMQGAKHRQYRTVWVNGRAVKVCTLVLETFVGPRPPGLMVLHADDVATHDNLPNLRWGNRIQNWDDALKNGHHRYAGRTTCDSGHEYDRTKTQRNGRIRRRCSTCQRAWRKGRAATAA